MVMKTLKGLCLSLALIGLTACSHLPAPSVATSAVATKQVPLILVSIDALRADYLDRGVTPNLKALAQGGAAATMHPSFPSLTFPNHYTLITGKRPDSHGVIANYMYDPTHPADPNDPNAAYFNKAKGGDAFWWKGATPMWVSAEKAGHKVGVVFWPSSMAEIDHVRPTYWLPFSKAATSDDRLNSVLQWMDLPEAQRPDVYMLYLDIVDEKGHKFGPDSAEVNTALGEVDSAIGRLRSELQRRGIAANIVIVSDHGMVSVSPDRVYYISDLLGKDGLDPAAKSDPRYDLINWGSVAMLNVRPGYEDLIDKALVKTHYPHMQCWHKGHIPAHYRFGHNPRVTDIVCLGEPGWQVGGLTSVGTDVGNHGYDAYSPYMNAIFIANGPAIKPGIQLKPFDNVDVYSLEMKLLGLKPEPNDGTLAPIKPALVNSH